MYLVQQNPVPRKEPVIYAVAGGKGGVGKTCLSVNMAIDIASKNNRVVLVDADLSCSNLETVLGVQATRRLDEFFYQKGGRKSLDSVLQDTPYPNLKFIPGTTGILDAGNPRYQQKQAFIRELSALDADVVIVDLDAGARRDTLDIFLMPGAQGVLVVNPEKTSMDNAFKFMRAALFRKIERFYRSPEVGILLRQNETLPDFLECVMGCSEFDDALRNRIHQEVTALARGLRPKLIVNRAHNPYEARVAANIVVKYARHHLLVESDTLGYISFDKLVQEAVNSGLPFVVSHPKHKLTQCIAEVTNRLGYI